MYLIYKDDEGKRVAVELGESPISIGRSPDADIQIVDDRVSRMHTGVRRWEDDVYVKDLNSKNGTYLNGERIRDIAKLNPNDVITVGPTRILVDVKPGKGTETILQEVQQEMETGKGYNTILREIVQGTGSEAEDDEKQNESS
ncbi:FHA domain-containing protein [Kiritimatiella glycovorans]|uniref:FHA domain-containing protein n=1 Tax=Kiritimatiella glycovorans TaxID=1307763 RepID=A0A0G3EEZ0_9BACT|nr:FHA domain-containing protein [Kiritimatiella glycovorans]AKJ64888.1 hypothetical protein L21SP4_01645 [Kiritimatiella glycovorans]